MPARQFEIPTALEGTTLAQLRKERSDPFRADLVANILGVDVNSPLQAGQSFALNTDPGSAEAQFIQNVFDPGGTAAQNQAQQVLADTQARESDFLNRFRTEIPQAVQSAEQEFNLPGLRDIAQQSMQSLEDLPANLEQVTRGRDITQSQLDRKIAAERAEQAPQAQRAVEQAQTAQGLVNQRVQQAIMPFDIERGLLGDQAQREFTLLRDQTQADLQTRLQELSNMNAVQIQQMVQQGRLDEMIKDAELAQQFDSGQAVDLGDRIAFISPTTGQELASFSKGLAPKRSTDTTGNIGTYYDATPSVSNTTTPDYFNEVGFSNFEGNQSDLVLVE